MSEEFVAITTQDEFDKRISERLKREKEKYEGQMGELRAEIDSMKLEIGQKDKALEEGKTGSEGLNKELEELKGKVSQYELSKLKTTIALQNGIPFDLADRLSGADEKSILEDAKKLASFVGRKEPIAPLKNPDSNGAKYEGLNADLLKVSQNITNKGE